MYTQILSLEETQSKAIRRRTDGTLAAGILQVVICFALSEGKRIGTFCGFLSVTLGLLLLLTGLALSSRVWVYTLSTQVKCFPTPSPPPGEKSVVSFFGTLDDCIRGCLNYFKQNYNDCRNRFPDCCGLIPI